MTAPERSTLKAIEGLCDGPGTLALYRVTIDWNLTDAEFAALNHTHGGGVIRSEVVEQEAESSEAAIEAVKETTIENGKTTYRVVVA